ncbi:hypothetical protein [Lysobacter solisilvae (ex Woo and Kim 2020)]|uniref:HEAT repeat domain-containing protein n=1 Tax=Agrilutibacter terrestris TaxID=2865112 RepID=A0A7H0FXM6_9GAMM|nr:hypothetical protein [Lysobacter terrestris]QNP40792.1 hypothetical protein H8B22_00545 [Lysobacter terrestris]
MNTLRYLALASLAFAIFSPAHAEQVEEGTKTPVVTNTNPPESSKGIRELLEGRPEIAALVSSGKSGAIAEALKEQLDNAGGKEKIAGAISQYLSKHPLKEGQDASDLASQWQKEGHR